jgi:5-methylcytosine-specific restriction enzyme A
MSKRQSSPYYRTAHWRALQAACVDVYGGCCVVPGCLERGVVADHIQTRPNVPYPTELDVIENLRLLCLSHDSQVKEQLTGRRRRAGRFTVKGCDALGRSLDPNHRWNKT